MKNIGGKTLNGRSYIALLLLYCVAATALALRSPLSVDAYWHIALGRELWHSGLSPWVDHYSYTFAGESLSNVPFLFELAIALLADLLEPASAALAFKLAVVYLLLGAVALWAWQMRTRYWLYAAAMAVVLTTVQLRLMARPELFSHVLLVILLMLLHRAGAGLRTRPMLAVAALIAIWSNYHTPVFGYVLLFGYFVDAAVQQWQAGEAATKHKTFFLSWAGWGVALLLVGFATPNPGHPLYALITFDNAWKELIQEYERSALFASLPIVYVLLAISVITLTYLVRARQYGMVIVWAVFSYNALLTARLVVPVGIVMVCLLLGLLAKQHRRERPTHRLPVATGLAVIALVLSAWSGIRVTSLVTSYDQQAAELLPTDVVDHMIRVNHQGRVFNAYEAGAYLVYRRGIDAAVYIDGRTEILYPVSHFRRFQQASTKVNVLREETSKYDISAALLRDTNDNHFLLDRTALFELDYVGQTFALFKRSGTGANLATLGRWYARPACAISEARIDTASEHQFAEHDLIGKTAFQQFRRASQTHAANPRQFATAIRPLDQLSDPIRRLVAYAAIATAEWTIATESLRHIHNVELRDMLALSYAHLRSNSLNAAEETMLGASKVSWNHLVASELQVAQRLMRSLRERQADSRIAPEFVQLLATQTARLGLAAAPEELSPAHFCVTQIR